MAKNAHFPKTNNPELVPITVERSAARTAAIVRLMSEGYKDDAGEVRSVRSIAHAEFLSKTSSIPPLPA